MPGLNSNCYSFTDLKSLPCNSWCSQTQDTRPLQVPEPQKQDTDLMTYPIRTGNTQRSVWLACFKHSKSGAHLNQGVWSWTVSLFRASLTAQLVKNLPAVQQTWIWSLGREDPAQKEMATPSGIFAWKTPWKEEPGGLQSTGASESRARWVTNTSVILGFQRWNRQSRLSGRCLRGACSEPQPVTPQLWLLDQLQS